MFLLRESQYEKFRHLRSGIYVIEGLIGVGKSTLGLSLENYLNSIDIKCKYFAEYSNKPLLEQYISNMPKYAYTFQLFMLSKRIEIYRQAEEFSKTGGISFIDRSIYGDMAFAYMQKEKGFISEEEWNIYLNIMKQEIQLAPTAILFLKCDLDLCLQRLNKRGDKSEISGYNIEYYQSLNSAYEHIMNNYNNSKYIEIDWNKFSDFDGIYLKKSVLEIFLNNIV
jgi:deoxyadenosine/deoxycytidine kinase